MTTEQKLRRALALLSGCCRELRGQEILDPALLRKLQNVIEEVQEEVELKEQDLPWGWNLDAAYKAYGEFAAGAESGRTFEGFIKQQTELEADLLAEKGKQ